MKVILLKDVAKLGRMFDVKEVADGYARNFLFPKGLAEPATPGAVSRIEKQKIVEGAKIEARETALGVELESLAETPVTITLKANEAGHLFAGLKQEGLLQLLRENGYHFTDENLHFVKPIKETGTHEIPIIVGKKEGKLILRVVGE